MRHLQNRKGGNKVGTYIPCTKEEQMKMLEEIGYRSFDDLFSMVPSEMKLTESLAIPKGRSEMKVLEKMESIADKNKLFRHIFRGAGAYHHYIPAIVPEVVKKEALLTAYTPYQAEISQGILQAIFEYQTMICQLTGMHASNASVYDGASAAAEACAMCTERKREIIYVSATTHPGVISTIQTYCFGSNTQVVIIPQKDGVTDVESLKETLSDTSACFYLQQPNYYGILEPVEELERVVHTVGAKFIMGCNPFSMAILKTPAEYGADVAVGEGQPLGLSLGFGGPYLGFMTATEKMTRKLPGRIVGQTVDTEGKRGFVLTLQAREQHIRREKASSNICSNQALCALSASVYMAAVGASGMKEVAIQCTSKAHYLQKALEKVGLELRYGKPFFHEFVTSSDHSSETILNALEEQGILGGLMLNDKEILWCTTEMNTKKEMDELVQIVKEVTGSCN